MANIYGRQVVLPLTNKSGGGVVAGDVVIIDTSNDGAFTTTTSGQYQGSVGVAQETIANNATGRVLVAGHAGLVNVPSSMTRGRFLETHTVAKQATGNATRRAGSFGQFMTGGTTPTAWLWGFPDNAGATGETVATSAIWTTAGKVAVATGSAAATEQWPPGHEFDYVEKTTNTTISGTAETSAGSTLVLTGNAATYDGGPVVVEFFCPAARSGQTAGDDLRLGLYESTSFLGRIGLIQAAGTSGSGDDRAFICKYRFTPSAGSHTYLIRGMRTNADGTLFAGAGGATNYVPAYMRITKA